MLLLGSEQHALLSAIFVHRTGSPALCLHYGVSFKGPPVSAGVLEAVTKARPGAGHSLTLSPLG